MCVYVPVEEEVIVRWCFLSLCKERMKALSAAGGSRSHPPMSRLQILTVTKTKLNPKFFSNSFGSSSKNRSDCPWKHRWLTQLATEMWNVKCEMWNVNCESKGFSFIRPLHLHTASDSREKSKEMWFLRIVLGIGPNSSSFPPKFAFVKGLFDFPSRFKQPEMVCF